MNRNGLIVTTLLYLAASGIFLGAWLRSEKHEPSGKNEASEKPMPSPVRKSPVQPLQKDYSYIVKNDPFHPRRGKAVEDEVRPAAQRPTAAGRMRFDLRGVFRSGEQYGAMMVVAGNAPSAGKDLKRANAEIFFTGAEVAPGYVLQEVGSHSVTILHAGEKLVVELEKLKQPEMNEKKENEDDKKDQTPGRIK